MKPDLWKKLRIRERMAQAVIVISIVARYVVIPNFDLEPGLAHILENAFQGAFGAALILLILWGVRREGWEKASPQQRREIELEEGDERNVAIREKAAAFAFDVSCDGLVVLFFLMSTLEYTLEEYAVLAVLVLQLIAYEGRSVWLKKRM